MFKKPIAKTLSRSLSLARFFRPSLYWGAEFLSDEVRLVGIQVGDGFRIRHTFSGTYADAEVFAQFHHLKYRGLTAAISHLPFKVNALEVSSTEPEEEFRREEARLLPVGLKSEAIFSLPFQQDTAHLLAQIREDHLIAFLQGLGEHLSTLRDCSFSPLILDPARSEGLPEAESSEYAWLMAEKEYTHILLFHDRQLMEHVKVPFGFAFAGDNPHAYALELKKPLVYHMKAKYPGHALGHVILGIDGPENEAANALQNLDIPQIPFKWREPLSGLPLPLRIAGTLALLGAQKEPLPIGVCTRNAHLALDREHWSRRSGVLLRLGVSVCAMLGMGAAILMLMAGGLRHYNGSQVRQRAGELEKLADIEKRRDLALEKMRRLQPVLELKSRCGQSLQEVASALVPELWLESWDVETLDGNGFHHRLTGFGFSDRRVSEFLASLEKRRIFRSVKLKFTERIKAEAVERKTGLKANHRELVYFQIQVAQ